MKILGDRDRLIKLIQEAEDDYIVYEMGAQALAIGIFKSREEYIADHLIANGVIVPIKVKGYTDYFIDEYGNVYSLKTHKYLSQEKGKDGYYYVQLCENGKRKRVSCKG